MTEAQSTYVQYRLDRACEALDESELLWKTAHYNTYVNRLYYACFYAVSALLLSKQISASTHTGVRQLFSQNFIKTGIVNRDDADVFFELFHYRQRSDYEDEFRVDKDIAEKWLEPARKFVKAMAQLAMTH